ncbi:MAG: hypothetical protein ACOYJB_07690 [Christensenellaceae bacterium]|jgi:hypothetical protein
MCVRLEKYLNQRAEWEARTGQDMYLKPRFAAAVGIPARIEKAVRVVKDSLGKEAVSDTTVYCLAEVKPFDRIDGREVISACEWTGRDGKTQGVEVYL